MLPYLMPVVYLYATSSLSPSQKSNHLKNSWSEALSTFYPLAGRLVANRFVDCNDAGVPFSEAAADCDLAHLLENRDPANITMFLPYKIHEEHDFCMAVRVTHLRCGGLALALLVSHKVADGISVAMFVNAWAASVAGDQNVVSFGAGAAHFPPVNISCLPHSTGIAREEGVAARYFTFPATKIAALQERYSAVGGRRPSRVEALSTFIWTQFVSAASATGKAHAVKHAVNLRNRTNPPLPENSFGNIIGASTTTPGGGDGGVELLRKVREAVKAVDGGYLARLKDGERVMKEAMMAQATRRDVVRFDFSSLCGFPVYRANFGWGRPAWVGLPEFPYKNMVYFMDTASGGGIEALVHLKKGVMDKFQPLLALELQTIQSKL